MCIHITSPSAGTIELDNCVIKEPEFSTAEIANETEEITFNADSSTMTDRSALTDLRWGTVNESGENLIEYDDSNGRFTALKKLKLNLVWQGLSGITVAFDIRKNGTVIMRCSNPANYETPCPANVDMEPGDYITMQSAIVLTGNAAITMVATATTSNVIVATDSTAPSRAQGSANTAMNAATQYFIGFTTANKDVNGNFSNLNVAHSTTYTSATYYTVPRSGYYDLSTNLYSADADLDSGEEINVRFFKNGSTQLASHSSEIETSLGSPVYTWNLVSLGNYFEKGDLISVGFSHGAGAAVSLETNEPQNYFEVKPSGATAVLAGLDLSEYSKTPNQSTAGTQVFVSALVTDGASTTTVSEEDDDFINGNCTNPATGSYTCTFTSSYWKTGTTPHCWVSPIPGGPREMSVSRNGVTSTSISFEQSGSAADSDFHLFCKGVK
jgi:hypothetical protein